jgi:hypothetical protein
MKGGPLMIVEPDSGCAVGNKLNVKKLNEEHAKDQITVTFSLTSMEGCVLKFQVPSSDGTIAVAYRDVINFGILVGDQQLYKAAGCQIIAAPDGSGRKACL